jgi:hypothetical protein
MAIACLRLVTFLPLRPLLSEPFLRFFIARSTYREALREYFRAICLLLRRITKTPVTTVDGGAIVTAAYGILFLNQPVNP